MCGYAGKNLPNSTHKTMITASGDTVHAGGRWNLCFDWNRRSPSHSLCCSPLLLQAQSKLIKDMMSCNKCQYSNPLLKHTLLCIGYVCMHTRLFWLVYNPPCRSRQWLSVLKKRRIGSSWDQDAGLVLPASPPCLISKPPPGWWTSEWPGQTPLDSWKGRDIDAHGRN